MSDGKEGCGKPGKTHTGKMAVGDIGHIQRKTAFKKTRAPRGSLQHYLQ